VPCPKDKDAVISVPQFTAGETTIKLPQITFRMVRQDVSFNVPQFTIRDYEKDQRKAEEKLEGEKELLQQALAEIKHGESARTAEAIRLTLKKLKDSAEAELNAMRTEALRPIDEGREELRKAREEAKKAITAAGGEWSESSYTLIDVERGLESFQRTVLKPYDDAQREINEKFYELVERYLGSVIEAKKGQWSAPLCGPPPAGTAATRYQP
jgi:hypothetical protein